MVKAERFPASVSLSRGRVGWRKQAVHGWISERKGLEVVDALENGVAPEDETV